MQKRKQRQEEEECEEGVVKKKRFAERAYDDAAVVLLLSQSEIDGQMKTCSTASPSTSNCTGPPSVPQSVANGEETESMVFGLPTTETSKQTSWAVNCTTTENPHSTGPAPYEKVRYCVIEK